MGQRSMSSKRRIEGNEEASRIELLRKLIDLAPSADLRERMIAALRFFDPLAAEKIVPAATSARFRQLDATLRPASARADGRCVGGWRAQVRIHRLQPSAFGPPS